MATVFDKSFKFYFGLFKENLLCVHFASHANLQKNGKDGLFYNC